MREAIIQAGRALKNRLPSPSNTIRAVEAGAIVLGVSQAALHPSKAEAAEPEASRNGVSRVISAGEFNLPTSLNLAVVRRETSSRLISDAGRSGISLDVSNDENTRAYAPSGQYESSLVPNSINGEGLLIPKNFDTNNGSVTFTADGMKMDVTGANGGKEPNVRADIEGLTMKDGALSFKTSGTGILRVLFKDRTFSINYASKTVGAFDGAQPISPLVVIKGGELDGISSWAIESTGDNNVVYLGDQPLFNFNSSPEGPVSFVAAKQGASVNVKDFGLQISPTSDRPSVLKPAEAQPASRGEFPAEMTPRPELSGLFVNPKIVQNEPNLDNPSSWLDQKDLSQDPIPVSQINKFFIVYEVNKGALGEGKRIRFTDVYEASPGVWNKNIKSGERGYTYADSGSLKNAGWFSINVGNPVTERRGLIIDVDEQPAFVLVYSIAK